VLICVYLWFHAFLGLNVFLKKKGGGRGVKGGKLFGEEVCYFLKLRRR